MIIVMENYDSRYRDREIFNLKKREKEWKKICLIIR